MANIALVVANRVRVVESIEQLTLPTAEAITAGNAVRIDPTTGKFTKANGTSTTENRVYGVATQTVGAGFPVTAIRRGVLDGFNFDSQDYDDAIYLSDTDGTLGDTAGTVSTIIGRVLPVFGNLLGNAPDKLLHVGL